MPNVDLDGKIILSEPHQMQMSCAGSGSIFESVVNNEKVKNAIYTSRYTQIVDIMNPTARIFDPEMIGYAAANDLKVAVRAFKPPSG